MTPTSSFPALPVEVVHDTQWARDFATMQLEIARLRLEMDQEREALHASTLDASLIGFACNDDSEKTLPIPGIDFDANAAWAQAAETSSICRSVQSESGTHPSVTSDTILYAVAQDEEKARLVHCLDLRTDLNLSEMDILFEALSKMKSLTVVNIGFSKRYSWNFDDTTSVSKKFEDIICDGTYNDLRALHWDTPYRLNVTRVLRSLPKLEYFSAEYDLPVNLHEDTLSFRDTLPVIYGIRKADLQVMASLYSPERLSTLPQAFGQMIKDGHPYFSNATKGITIWLGDVSQESQDFVKSISAVFPQVISLNLILDNGFNLPMEELESILFGYTNLETFYFLLSRKKEDVWTLGGATVKSSRNIKVSVARQIASVCPKIAEVQFPDEDFLSRYRDSDGTWSHWTFN